MIIATSFWTGSSKMMKHGLHTLPQKPSSSQCIGVTVDLRQDEIQADCVGAESDVYGVLGQTGHSPFRHPDQRRDGGAERYCETLQKLRRAIQNKRHGMVSDGVILLHDNARPLTARRSTHFLQQFSWEVFIMHPIARTSLPLISILSYTSRNSSDQRQRFQNDGVSKMSVTQWFQFQAADFYDTWVQKLVSRYDKCLNSGDEYV